ncbi:MAG: phage tail sheath subtilisin-like domain-containing protein [Candidatus Sulfopaludibacter sp.]|nr:phage tail sheath subtilisin-like domain-containing protein [Candidatus Sulfopaludibacter sp.]
MPEYLSPGVYIEEIPPSLQAIEGVSTTTSAFVGRADRGPVPGYAWPGSGTPEVPFTPTGGFVLTPDPSPVLVTSFADFQRQFGPPLPIPTPPDPTDYGFLGWAVKAFFDNNGKRVYIARIVDPTDTPSTMRTAQGVVYRLLRAAQKTDTSVFLTSSRGLNVGDAVTFIRHSDGQNVLTTPDQAAIAVGGTAPFALQNGDSIQVASGGSSVTGTWTAVPAIVKSTAGTLTFPGLLGTTLGLRAGGPAAPLQDITFTSGDPVTPLSATPTLAEVTDYLSRRAVGVNVYFDAGAGQLVIATAVAGLSAQLAVSGNAVGPLTLGSVTPSGGNVGDISHVTISEIAAQLSLPGVIAAGENGSGKLQIATVATGAAVSLTLTDVAAGTLDRLGYGAVSTLTVNGASGATPNLAAIAGGGLAPFALLTGDSLKVTSGGSSVTGTWTSQPATVKSTAGTATFPGLVGTTLVLQAGPSAPHVSVTFTAGDPVTPLSATPTLAEVTDYLSRHATGYNVYFDAAAVQLVIETEASGTGAQLTISGTAVGPLTLGAVTPGVGNVADISHVTIAEVAAQLSLPGKITVGDNGSGALRIASVATGASASVTLTEVTAGTLSRLGYGAVSTLTVNGTNGVGGGSPSLTIVSYNSQNNSIAFGAPVGAALDPTDVYAIVSGGANKPNLNAGPLFIARTPGDWSAGLQVLISNSDRQPSPILGTSTIAAGATQLKVQNVTSFYVGAAVEIDYSGTGRSSHQIANVDSGTRQITISPPTVNAINPAAAITPLIRTLEIDVIVIDTTGASPTETYRGLAWNQTPGVADVRRHYAWTINANSNLVWVQPPGVGSPTPLSGSEDFTLATQPCTPDGFPMNATAIGADTMVDLDDTWVGANDGPGQRTGIQAFLDLTDASIIAAPGKTSQTIQLALIDQCEQVLNRFALLDGERDPAGGSLTSILTHRSLYDTSYAAYYQPWEKVSVDGQYRYLPPAGYMAGIYARVDDTRGVWKAPANEPVLNVLGLKTNFTNGEQDILNPVGVNLIRQFDYTGPRVWGARTLSSDTDLIYINVRRTLIFLEVSIGMGTQWVVFEPNTPLTWQRVTDSVTAFLTTQWNAGALFGSSASQAFFVRCDETTMTSDDILNGRLICQIGVAIVRPAEFVIFRIQQITSFSTTNQ